VKKEFDLFEITLAPAIVRWTACESRPEDNVSIKDKQRPRKCGGENKSMFLPFIQL
jgi:hypothetical protein